MTMVSGVDVGLTYSSTNEHPPHAEVVVFSATVTPDELMRRRYVFPVHVALGNPVSEHVLASMRDSGGTVTVQSCCLSVAFRLNELHAVYVVPFGRAGGAGGNGGGGLGIKYGTA